MQSKITEQLVTEIGKRKEKIDSLKYGQVVFVIHHGTISRGQIIESFEPSDKPGSGSIKNLNQSINPAAGD
ncbi:MAG: hypothetical protein ACOY35_08240 [Bacillota bacterium]